MKSGARQDKARLLATAREVAAHLKLHSVGTRLRIRIPSRVWVSNTDGWYVAIGDLGKRQPRLEIWVDRFSGYPERKFYACFRAEIRQQLTAITKRVGRELWPVRVVASEDTTDEPHLALALRLGRSEFNAPILEKYEGGRTFYGIYDPTKATKERIPSRFCARAADFFLDVVHSLPGAKAESESREIYPQCENRRWVASHLQRERSSLLATERKIRDDYTCQVCGLRFEDVYGKLGRGFAESHHLIPLSQSRGPVKTRLADLCTVCANCHRMLHRMPGKRGDIAKLKAIVRKHRA